MAEMVGLSRELERRNGGLFAALKRALSRLTWGRREARLDLKEWPDYLLRDIGMGQTARDGTDPRSLPTDWPLR